MATITTINPTLKEKTTKIVKDEKWKLVASGDDKNYHFDEPGFVELYEYDENEDDELLGEIHESITLNTDKKNKGQERKKKRKRKAKIPVVKSLKGDESNIPSHDDKKDDKTANKKPKLAHNDEEKSEKTKDIAHIPNIDMSAWESYSLSVELHSQVLDAIHFLGFSTPSEIQLKCIPSAINDTVRPIVGAAETGSGKTLAFLIPIVHWIISNRERKGQSSSQNHLKALIIAPTRELAIQVADQAKILAKYAGIVAVPVVGGLMADKQRRLLGKQPDIVVATPGRLWELLSEGEPHLSKLSLLRFLVIDEADRIMAKGHFRELELILHLLRDTLSRGSSDIVSDSHVALVEKVRQGKAQDSEGVVSKSIRSKFQAFIFSATLTADVTVRDEGKKEKKKRKSKGKNKSPDDTDIAGTVLQHLGITARPRVFDLTGSFAGPVSTLVESYLELSEDQKDEALYYIIYRFSGRVIVFANSITATKHIRTLLEVLNIGVYGLHAQMQQRARLKALERFRADTTGVMIATDVAARGLDITGVDLIIHYQAPRSAENYIHRCGRSARAGANGASVVFVSAAERAAFHRITDSLNQELAVFPIDAAFSRAIHQRVSAARSIEKISKQRRDEATGQSWLHRQAAAADMIIDESIDLDSDNEQRRKKNGDGNLVGAQGRLNDLLKQPLVPRGILKDRITRNLSLASENPAAFDFVPSVGEKGKVSGRAVPGLNAYDVIMEALK